MAGLADAHLTERVRELLCERSFHVLRQLGDRSSNARPASTRDGEQIERVRQLGPQLVTARTSAARHDEAGNDEPESGQAERDKRPMVPAEEGDAENEAEQPPTIVPAPSGKERRRGDRPAHAGGQEPDVTLGTRPSDFQ